ncbi:Na+/H+ antiporter NhaC [candidate division KSB1 bacterium]|nr:MAG: Na+/H+ antiporter NhaC [candidate division KSB1 bacterium]
MNRQKKEIPLSGALIPVVFLIIALFFTIAIFKQQAHIPLIFATAVAAIVAIAYGYHWTELRKGMIKSIALALNAILILMIIGTMIGTWIKAGIVPSMIYYGLKLLSPTYFLTATLLICSIVSLGTGSSWATAGTVGVAFIGIGKGLGIPVQIVAGAIISGAYFGDKMSPLSDTTNLAPAVAGTDIFSHIRHMIYTTTPGYIISIILYTIIGFRFRSSELTTGNIDIMLSALKGNFTIHPLLLVPPVIVIIMVIKKIPALPALFSGSVLGALIAGFVQSAPLPDIITAAYSGVTANTGNALVDELLNRGGLLSMMQTITLVMCALSLGGVMEQAGMLGTIAGAMLKRVKSTGGLITTTILSCIGMNAFASDQYLAIVIPGRMYKDAFRKRGLHPKNLSRCLEDSGTLTSSLIPWNTGGAFMHVTLTVSPLAYMPYAFFNLITPLISIIYGYTGFTITKLDKNDTDIIEDDITI